MMMNADEDYGFDVFGFIHIPQALTPAEVDACNQALDAVGGEEGGLLDSPHGDPFRALQQHPVLQV